jgi:hypothetical protein
VTVDGDEHTDYLSYLLRLWRVDEAPTDAVADMVWRASLESPFTGERMSFACLEDLCDFLREQTGHTRNASGDKDDHATTVIL